MREQRITRDTDRRSSERHPTRQIGASAFTSVRAFPATPGQSALNE
jgi:hypothetical protein